MIIRMLWIFFFYSIFLSIVCRGCVIDVLIIVGYFKVSGFLYFDFL